MSILNKLTIKNLKLNKKRTIVTIIGIILSTALMVGIGLLFSSFQDYMIRETISYNGRYESNYENADLSKVSNLKVKNFVYFYEKTIGFSEFESKNEYKPYIYVAGVNEEFFNELKLVDGRFPNNDDEIVISEHINTNGGASYKVGDNITLSYGERVIEGDIVLDSFLGSGTTAAVAHKMRRRYIGVELGEHAYTHCYNRLKLVISNEDGDITLPITVNKIIADRINELCNEGD